MQAALEQKPDGSYRSLGESMKVAKNITYATFNDPANNRKFTLLGDPALTLSFPELQVRLTHINERSLDMVPDTFKASGRYEISGQVENSGGNRLSNFNGVVFLTLYDKAITNTTRGNDPGSIKRNYEEQSNVLFKGSATITNGVFKTSMMLPRDIDYRDGKGMLRLYANNGTIDGNGIFENLVIGGSVDASDQEGPEIQAWIDDFAFKNGNTVGERPLLLLSLKDSSGINISTHEPAHRITAILNGRVDEVFELNPCYTPVKDNYREGFVRFSLPQLQEGLHELKIKAWDGANNSSEKVLTFRVSREKAVLFEIYNYPNPVTSQTTFCFDHNRPAGEPMEVSARIVSINGQLVKSIYKTINANGYRSCDMEWDGLDESGKKVGTGIYIWQMQLKTIDGRTGNKSKMLLIL
jgi:hypothetical protein